MRKLDNAAELELLHKVLRFVCKKLPFKSDRAMEKILEFAADSKAEAYRIGAEETQTEIVRRIQRLLPKD